MDNIIGNVSGDESVEEIGVKREKLLDAIQGRLTAGNNVVNILLLYFPNEPSEHLIKFWDDVADAVVKDSEQVTYQVAKQAIANVEQWAKEHSAKTRQSEFLKMYPDAEISDDGLPSIAPCQLNAGLIQGKSQTDCEDRGVCDKCRHDFWLKEIE
mgnify:CR=1 FL=1